MAVGSLADAPKDLLNEIKQLENQFTIDKAKLKEITNHFVNELTKGQWSVPTVATRLTLTNKSQA
jgi:hexokinase